MQRWIGLLVMVLGIAHVTFAIVAGWSDLGGILRGGVAGLESAPAGDEAAFWSLLFGVVAATVGYQLYWSARRFGATSLVPGVGLIAIGMFGAFLAPRSPFWLILILGILAVVAARRGQSRQTPDGRLSHPA